MTEQEKIKILTEAIKKADLQLKQFRVTQTRLDLNEALEKINEP